ncbi:MAG: transglycosylase SLT domain-containing protein [Deltaproteobacteria bacterium]|nr:transglycosylase SLT domain-containing protein [Deltaproteobacteria bacterium]
MIARSVRRSFVALVALVATAGASQAKPPSLFPEPAALRAQVAFWERIFGVYSKHQIVLHDPENLARVYSVLDFRDRAAAGESELVLELAERDAVAQERERIRGVLLRLDARQGNTGGLDDDERKLWDLFGKDKDPKRFALAADAGRIRSQRGLRERFAEGVRISRRYLAEMEEVFRREGLPVELTRLPLVESCFDIEAYSKVGAAGIWQFMPSTGRNYMAIAGVVDERRDPLRATRGAALHLKENYEVLGNWPLAITAYNHGRAGMARAARETGTDDIGKIVKRYRGPLFGFASRNFYAEFLAALHVERRYRDYFGELQFEGPFVGDEVRLSEALAGHVAASCADVPPAELAALNPAVDSAVFLGGGNIPRGYLLRVPQGTAGAFQQRLAQIAADARIVAVRSGRKADGRSVAVRATPRGAAGGEVAARTHTVRRGQTLSHIAERYRVPVGKLRDANRLRGNSVKAGQVLRIPTG